MVEFAGFLNYLPDIIRIRLGLTFTIFLIECQLISFTQSVSFCQSFTIHSLCVRLVFLPAFIMIVQANRFLVLTPPATHHTPHLRQRPSLNVFLRFGTPDRIIECASDGYEGSTAKGPLTIETTSIKSASEDWDS